MANLGRRPSLDSFARRPQTASAPVVLLVEADHRDSGERWQKALEILLEAGSTDDSDDEGEE